MGLLGVSLRCFRLFVCLFFCLKVVKGSNLRVVIGGFGGVGVILTVFERLI